MMRKMSTPGKLSEFRHTLRALGLLWASPLQFQVKIRRHPPTSLSQIGVLGPRYLTLSQDIRKALLNLLLVNPELNPCRMIPRQPRFVLSENFNTYKLFPCPQKPFQNLSKGRACGRGTVGPKVLAVLCSESPS